MLYPCTELAYPRRMYYYDGRSFDGKEEVITAIRHDLDFSLGDSDLDAYLRSNGGVCVDGTGCMTAMALKRHSPTAYREVREEFIDLIMSEVRDGIEEGGFPMRIPFTDNILESSD